MQTLWTCTSTARRLGRDSVLNQAPWIDLEDGKALPGPNFCVRQLADHIQG